ncbi:hypothetical protein FE257_012411 [Aspergillus nanangensis]|uniref:Retrotransposon gag domain-containing protein n=1 Tax=Aspergillus nanangensis TaxID=2582783 RepID=A0AAD4CUK1_ASPNN|nr:hypothetical protein FE257_012411 [Aspergillus nanangensis]
MADRKPTFSGNDEENVGLYIKECKCCWLSYRFPKEQTEELIGMTMMTGLKGTALRYVSGLAGTDTDDWHVLAEHLKKRFPKRKSLNMAQEAMSKMFTLNQKDRPLNEYITEVREVSYYIPDREKTMIHMFMRGLSDVSTGENLTAYVRGKEVLGEKYTLEDIICLSRAFTEEYRHPGT